MKKPLMISAIALLLALSLTPLMAAETNEHQGHQPTKTEHDHGQATPAKSDAGDHRDQMEKKMAKMSIQMEKMKRELAEAEERMTALKGVLEKVQQTPLGAERNKLLAEHGAGLRTLLAGLRAKMEEKMAKMEQMMGKEKRGGMMGGMDHAGEKKEHGGESGMMDQEMMDDMAGHHEVMKKRLALLTDLMGQMEAHLVVISAPQ